MARVLHAEWLRLGRYWLTWALAGAWIILLAVQINAKLVRLEELDSKLVQPPGEMTPLEELIWRGDQIEAEMLRSNLRYPDFIGFTARQASGIGWFLVIIFTAVIGSEDFGRRTLHPILARGVRRSTYLLARCLAVWLAYGAGLAAIAILAVLSGLAIHSRVASEALTFSGTGAALLQVVRAWLAGLPFITLTLIWAVLARNAGPALGVGIGLHFLEYFCAFMLPAFTLALSEVGTMPRLALWALRLFSLSPNYNAEMLLNWGPSMLLERVSKYLLVTDPWMSTLLLAVYTLLSLGLAIWSLSRRDVVYGG
jgi:ABC-type transport system involved in multi-copper enzyme maturation permease subunit